MFEQPFCCLTYKESKNSNFPHQKVIEEFFTRDIDSNFVLQAKEFNFNGYKRVTQLMTILFFSKNLVEEVSCKAFWIRSTSLKVASMA